MILTRNGMANKLFTPEIQSVVHINADFDGSPHSNPQSFVSFPSASIVCFLAIVCAFVIRMVYGSAEYAANCFTGIQNIVVRPINLLYLIEIAVVWTRIFDFGRKRGIMGF